MALREMGSRVNWDIRMIMIPDIYDPIFSPHFRVSQIVYCNFLETSHMQIEWRPAFAPARAKNAATRTEPLRNPCFWQVQPQARVSRPVLSNMALPSPVSFDDCHGCTRYPFCNTIEYAEYSCRV